MRICITSQGETLDSSVDPRFGRCSWFILVDPETMDYEAVSNSNAQAMGGAGIQAGQMMVDKGANVVLTGNMGPNAYQTLQAGGLEIITGVSGLVKEAVEKYKKGELKASDAPNVQSHFGMRRGQ